MKNINNIEEIIAALADEKCCVEIEKSIQDKDGALTLYHTDTGIKSSAYQYSTGEVFLLRDWQGARPESLEEIPDFDWVSESGKSTVILDGRPRIL